MNTRPTPVDTLIEGIDRLLFPGVDGAPEVIENASVALLGGQIEEVGPARELAGLFHPTIRVDGRGKILTPGLVDSHTHLVFAGDRSGEFRMRCAGAGYEEIADDGGGIRASVRATREASEEELFELSLPRLERMVSSGSTTVEIKSGYGLDLETELRMLRVIRRLDEISPARIVSTFMGAHEIPDEYRADRDEYVRLICEEMIPRVAEEGLATFCDVFCEEGVFTPDETRKILETGSQHGLQPKVHADELAASGGSEVAAELRVVSADHLMEISSQGIEGLARSGVVATLLPGTTFYLAKKRYAPARKILDAGLEIALATDRNPGSCTVESLVFICGLACLQMGLTPLEALRAATIGGSKALGLADECGTIEKGKNADLVLWGVSHEDVLMSEFENQVPREIWIRGSSLDR